MADVEREVASILDATSDAFFAVDDAWVILRVNSAHERVSRMPRSEQVGKNLLDLFFSGPDAQQTSHWAAYHRAMNERVAVYFEEFYAPLGIWTSGNAYPTAEGGLSVFYRDITDQKTSERQRETERRKFEALFASSPIAMALLRGQSFVFEMLNARWEDLVSPREYVGRRWADVYHELSNSLILDRLAHVLETGETYHAHEMELRVEGPEGGMGLRYYDFSEVRICDADNQPYGVLCYTLDVTERVLSRQLLESSESRLQQAVQARDTFLGIASHELKTPLTSWSLQAQISQRAFRRYGAAAFTPDKINKLIESSVTQVRRLSRLVDDMLDVSRIAAGRLSVHLQPVDFSELVAHTVERMGPYLEAAGCRAETQLASHLHVDADALRLEQVLGNLLSNCIKYAPGTPVHVQLSQTQDSATLTVRDHGPGVAPAMRTRIFERFERLISASEVSGLGLGLHIAQQIVQAHGGSVELAQPEGPGAAFVVKLPLAFSQTPPCRRPA